MEPDFTKTIEAGGRAAYAADHPGLDWDQAATFVRGEYRHAARVAIEAALPELERHIREQAAREIEAYNATMQLGDDVFQDEGKAYLDKAAAIARGKQHLWPCGCLIDEADAHRVGCFDVPKE